MKSILVIFALAASASSAELERYEFREPHMGASFGLLFYAADAETANKAARAAFARVAELNDKLSDYDPESELSRLSRTSGSGRAVPVSDDLWRVLSAAQSFSRRSGGAFDATVGPYVRLWRRARRDHEMPRPDRLKRAAAAVGYQYLQLDAEHQTARLTRPHMRLGLGGIAKGYAADAALQVLADHGIDRALVDAGGDLALGAPPPGRDGWRIGVAPLAPRQPPSRYLLLHNCGVATSGDAWQFVELDGKRYSHIVDPATGLGLTTRSGVTVVAPNCTQADALASAVSVLGPRRGVELVESLPEAAALVVTRQDGRAAVEQSKRMKEMRSSEHGVGSVSE